MIEVVRCITYQHDPWLVSVAVLICCIGAFAVGQMFERVRKTQYMQRAGWILLTAIAAGATIWCTHFVAMIAYNADLPISLDPVMTIVSLIAAIGGTAIGLTIAIWRRNMVVHFAGGAVVGAAISAMHFIGMTAYRVDGIVEWRTGYVVAAVLCALILSGAAFAAMCSSRIKKQRLLVGAGLLVAAIASLHFTAMTAMRITPLALGADAVTDKQMHALGLATAMVGFLVIAAGISAAFIDRQTRSDAMIRLHQLAMNDSLTDLPNRTSFNVELQRQADIALSTGKQLALLAIDLNRFKEINDIHGHKAGDYILQNLSLRMREELQNDEIVARIGGDEFAALILFEDRDRLGRFASRLDAALRAPLDIGGFEVRVGASIGIATYPDDADDIDDLASNADLAMYRAKRAGSLEPSYFNAALDEAIRDRRELANDLRYAIEGDQLHVHYQVQASIQSREVTGYEALLRWEHPVRGNIPPSDFIPVAEENGLILQLGEWVMRKACADAASWDNDLKVAVNVSPLQLAHADLPRQIHQILLSTGLPPRRLEVELTETALMGDRAHALHVLRQIKALGVGVALDDFGTGYSSLETLRIFPFDKIKLDRFFISGLEDSVQDAAIVRAVLALGKSLDIPVLAEGIESDAQFATLLREGCDEAQGYLLGRPGPMHLMGKGDPVLSIDIVAPLAQIKPSKAA